MTDGTSLCLLTWCRGQGGSLKSCDSLLKRVEGNDTKLVELVILPMKTFGGAELDRLSNALGKIRLANASILCSIIDSANFP